MPTNNSDNVVLRDQEFTKGRTNYFLVGPPCLDQQQIEHLKKLVDETSAPADLGGMEDGMRLEDIRRTQAVSLHPQGERWAYELIERTFMVANEHMRCDIVPEMSDPIQILRYDEEDEGCYIWHADTLPSDMTRKMSVVVPLSDPSEYAGGRLQFNQGGTLHEIPQTPGKPVVFPSWLIHQVTPVTKGHRYSLVAWIRGPNWR